MSNIKRGLGRGLADLIPVGGDVAAQRVKEDNAQYGGLENSADSFQDTDTDNQNKTLLISVALIHPNPNQPRTYFDDAALAELAESIRVNGILQPILVRPRQDHGESAGNSEDSGYEIVAGERRFRAALRVGLIAVPVVIRAISDAESIALALIENLIRSDIGPLETARAFRRLIDEFGWTQEEMAKKVGKSRPAVANSLRLLALPLPIQHSVERGEITEGHARALLQGGSDSDTGFAERQIRVFRRIVDEKLSVRDVERLMDKRLPARTDAPNRENLAPSVPVSNRTSGNVPPSPPAAGVVNFTADSSRPGSGYSASPPLRNLEDSAADTDSTAGFAKSPEPVFVRKLSSTGYMAGEIEERSVEDRLRSALSARVRLTGTVEKGKIEIEFFSADELNRLIERVELGSEIGRHIIHEKI